MHCPSIGQRAVLRTGGLINVRTMSGFIVDGDGDDLEPEVGSLMFSFPERDFALFNVCH